MVAHPTIYLHILWHQHQPWYLLPGSNLCGMPWVRLHGVKDYYDMAHWSLQFAGWKQTINLVPSLLLQLQGYIQGTVTDTALLLSRKPADALTPEDKKEILSRFFDGHAPKMIHPFPRYDELYRKRGAVPEKNPDRFTTQDYLDLQVWHNLVWIDPLWWEMPDSPLPELLKKQRGFSEAEKQRVLDFQMEILKKIIPLHQQLRNEKKIEITTTPYYHPILPLLCDNRIAQISNPRDPVPDPPFLHPEDAEWHIREGLRVFESIMGFRPGGMWPSEGSVSDQACALMAAAGLKFFATDGGLLFQSKFVRESPPKPSDLYRLHRLQTSAGEIDCVFRNREFSDLIGFAYSKMDAREAARNFISRVKQIGDSWEEKTPPLVNVILDGENCWEFYDRDGRDFLKYLIDGLLHESQIRLTTVPEFQSQYPAVPTLRSIFPGSWINQNFRIWIGHHEDNAAWHFLRLARETLTAEENQVDPAAREQAWNELHICEGSDWFWWYGDENTSTLEHAFDSLFRSHLMRLYELLGKPVPEALKRPIKQPKQVGAGGGILFRKPKLTGRRDSYYEWVGSRGILVTGGGGAMHQAEGIEADLQYGRLHRFLCFLIQFRRENPITPDTKVFVQITKPVVKTLLAYPPADSEAGISNRRLEGMVDLEKAGIAPHQEVWFFLEFSPPGKPDYSLPHGSELYLQGYTKANASLYWFL